MHALPVDNYVNKSVGWCGGDLWGGCGTYTYNMTRIRRRQRAAPQLPTAIHAYAARFPKGLSV